MDEQRAWLKSKRKRRLRTLAVILSVCVLFTSSPHIWETVSVFAAEESEGEVRQYISGFAALSEEVREQSVPLGTELHELSLPDALEAYITVEDAENSGGGVETPGDSESGDASANEETDDEGIESDDSEAVSEGNEPEPDGVEENGGTGEAEEGEPSDVEQEEPEEGEASDTEQEEPSDTQQEDRKESGNTDADAETGDGQDTQSENGGESGGTDESNKTDSGDAADTENQETHTVSMPEYYAEHVISIQTLENTPAEEEKEPQTEEREETPAEEKREPEKKEQEVTVTISGVTWQSDPAYDGSAEGTYIFTAVLPEGYALAEGVSLPEITVTVGTTDAAIQALLARIAALPDAEEYLAAEPDSDDYGDDEDGYEEAYMEWMEGLYSYAGEALAIWEEIEELPEKEQVLIPQEAADKLAAWVEIANAAQESTQVMAAAGGHTNHTGWTKLANNTTTLAAGKQYYLEGDVELNAALSVSGSGTVDLCLNGNNLTSRYAGEKTWLITVPAGVTLNVYDCNGNGRLGAGSKQIGGISVSGTLNVYGGSICGEITSEWFQLNWYKNDPMALAYSSAVYACGAGAAVNLYGGSIEGKAATCVYVDSGARLVVEGGNVNSTIDCTTDRNGNVGVQVAAIYVNQGAAAEVKAGRVSATTISGENLHSGDKNGGIEVMPTGSITISGGTVESVGENCGGIDILEDVYWLENFTVAEGTTYANISGGTINGNVGARGDDIEVTVTGGEITELVSLFGAAKLKMEGSQKIGTASAETEDIAINRLNNGKGYGTVVLTGALTNSVPYLVGTYRTPSSQYPIVFTENFTTYMSGKTPTEYFKSVNGYKVVLLNGEAALMPYVMTFDANGGACETKTGDIGGGNPLRALPEPTRTGYSSDGWYTEKTGGDKITIDAMPSGQDMTVYAHWTPVDYAITYDLADGTLQDGDSNPASYHIETPDFTLKNPVRAGYVFTGWSGTGLTGEANKTVTVPKGSTGERAYTAHWGEAKYKVMVNTYKDGTLWSSGAPAVKLTADNGSSFVTDLTAVGNGSYRIYSGNVDTGVTVTVNGADATARVDYYTLSFYDGDREVAPSQTVLKGKNAKPCVLTKAGYQFAGWCGDKSLSGTPVTDISAPITEQKIFYAKWTAKTYKVTFDDQGATGGNVVGNQTVTYDAAYGELPEPTKAGYVFKGWYTSQNGQGSPVDAATIVRTASDHTLYAYWKDEAAPGQPTLQDGMTLPTDWTNTQTTIPLKLYDEVGVTGLLVSVDGSSYVEISGFSGGTGSVNYGYTVQSGEHKYQFKAVDAAGNTSAESDIFTVKLDQTKPEIGTITYENKAANLWQWIIGKTSLIIHVPVTDTGSGVTGIRFCLTPRDAAGNLDSGSAVTDTATVSGGEAKITFDADFRGTIAINCTDAAGNAADSVTIGADAGGVIAEDKAPDITIQADRNPFDTQQTQPGGVAVADGYYDTAPALLVKVKDDTDNAVTGGLASVTYQVGDGAEKTVTVDQSTLQKAAQAAFTILASEIPTGITKIKVTATDNAGNEAAESITVKVKGPEKTPGAEIDYWEEELKNLVPGEKYTIDGMEYTADQEGRISLIGDWLGTTVSIVKKGNGNETTDSLAQSLSVPARPAAPHAPELGARDETSITLQTIAGARYRRVDGTGDWQDSTGFEGLEPGTIYSFQAYYLATATSFASAESSPAQIATVPAAPTKEKLKIGYGAETLTLTDGIEVFTDAGCTTPVTAGSAEAYMGQTIYIRYPADGIIPESLITPVPIPARPAKPTPGTVDASYPKAADGAITGLTSGKTYEYRVKNKDGNFGEWKDTVPNGTKIENLPAGDYQVRVKAVETGNVSFRSEAAAVTIGEKPATKYDTPDIRIDYTKETLTGFVSGAKYTIGGDTIMADADGTLPIRKEWFGTALSIMQNGNGKDKLDSDIQSLPVPARPVKPTPKGVDVSTAGGTGKLTGLTAGVAYEVSADGGSTWMSRTADGSGQITELAPGTYVVHVKAGTSSFASENSDRAEIGTYQVKVTFMANGENYREVFVDYGGTLTDIPAVPPKRDAGDQTYTSEWCSDQQGTPAVFTNLMADMTVYAVYTSTYTVALQGGTGYTLSAQAGSTSPVKEGGSFTFGFALSNGYQKTAGFAVKVNGVKAELTADGTYTISDIRENKTVTAEGVAKKPGKPSDPDGDKDKEDNSKSESEDPTPQPEDSESHNPTPKPPVTLPGKGKGPTPGTTSPAETDRPASEQKKPETGSNSGQEPEAQPTQEQTERQRNGKSGNAIVDTENKTGQGATVADNGGQSDSGTVRSVTATIDQGRIVVSGEKIPTGNVAGMEQASTEMALGNGAVFITVVCEDEKYAAGVKDTEAVANAVLSAEQVQLVNDGKTIEIRVDVKDISEKVPQKDKEVIENGLTRYQEEVPSLTLGRYVDISMFMKIGESDWDAITSTEEPIEVVIGVPEDMREDGREFYIIRAHEGEHTFMRDLDEEPDTITISTDMFSSYAIAYVTVGSGNGGNVCGLCHICPTFLGVCCFIWLAAAIVVILFAAAVILRRKKGK